MHGSANSLLARLIDYAGLFPPAKLPMPKAVEAYARDLAGPHAWMLGRFICPASRLAEFAQHAAILLPGTHATSGYRERAGGEPWRLSAIIDGELEPNLDAIDAFNAEHEDPDRGLARVDSIELKASTPGSIDEALDVIPEDLFPFFEFPIAGDCRGFVAALAGNDSSAKVRTGGTTPEAFPTCAQLADFVIACRGAGVSFKATAGLHHPIRSEHPLTYEPGCARGTMHGFVNLFAASAFLRAGPADRVAIIGVIEERDPASFELTHEGLRWNGLFADPGAIEAAREGLSLSFGSCSFDEPVADLQALGWL